MRYVGAWQDRSASQQSPAAIDGRFEALLEQQMSKPFLSLTIERESKTIQLCVNDAGIDRLIDALQKLRTAGHMHLWDTTDFPDSGILSQKDPWGQPAICDVSMTTGPFDE